MPANDITERDRFPLLDERGQKMLNRISQHPHAPKFNYHCGEKLTGEGLQLVRQFAEDIKQEHLLNEDGHPDWLDNHVRRCSADVPFFRQRAQSRDGRPFSEIPFTDVMICADSLGISFRILPTWTRSSFIRLQVRLATC